jgi:hypothetical protein
MEWKIILIGNEMRISGGYNFMTEKEIAVVMNALAGEPTLTSVEFANKVEKILRNYKESEVHE